MLVTEAGHGWLIVVFAIFEIQMKPGGGPDPSVELRDYSDVRHGKLLPTPTAVSRTHGPRPSAQYQQ
jgi:hypothetical protein